MTRRRLCRAFFPSSHTVCSSSMLAAVAFRSSISCLWYLSQPVVFSQAIALPQVSHDPPSLSPSLFFSLSLGSQKDSRPERTRKGVHSGSKPNRARRTRSACILRTLPRLSPSPSSSRTDEFSLSQRPCPPSVQCPSSLLRHAWQLMAS